MTTVTGTILDATGTASRVRISFKSLSTPFVLGTGEIIAHTTVYTFTDPTDGTFSIALEPGSYTVVYMPGTITTSTTFRITVPVSGPVDIGSIITSGLTSAASTAAQASFIAGTGAPTEDPANPAVAAFCYNRSGMMWGWDIDTQSWIGIIE